MNPDHIIPRKSRILVREHDTTQTVTSSGLVVMREQPTPIVTGLVLAVGPTTPPDVFAGCVVGFRRSCGRELGERLLILEYDQLEYAVDPEDVRDTMPAPAMEAAE